MFFDSGLFCPARGSPPSQVELFVNNLDFMQFFLCGLFQVGGGASTGSFANGIPHSSHSGRKGSTKATLHDIIFSQNIFLPSMSSRTGLCL